MDLPYLGTALTFDALEGLKDWIFEADRAIEIQDFVFPDVITGDTGALVERYRAALDGHKGERGIHGPFFGLDISNPDAEICSIVQKRFLKGLEIAEGLGATHMVIHSPFTYWHVLNAANYPKIRSDMFAASAECLAPVLERAKEIGCVLMLENIDDTDPATRVDLVAEIDHPALKVSIDTGHAELAFGRYNAPPVVDFIAAAGNWLGHVHLQDADGYADRHWHPGEGNIPWAPVFAALSRLDARPRLILEVRDRHHLLPQTVKRLEALGLAR